MVGRGDRADDRGAEAVPPAAARAPLLSLVEGRRRRPHRPGEPAPPGARARGQETADVDFFTADGVRDLDEVDEFRCGQAELIAGSGISPDSKDDEVVIEERVAKDNKLEVGDRITLNANIQHPGGRLGTRDVHAAQSSPRIADHLGATLRCASSTCMSGETSLRCDVDGRVLARDRGVFQVWLKIMMGCRMRHCWARTGWTPRWRRRAGRRLPLGAFRCRMRR